MDEVQLRLIGGSHAGKVFMVHSSLPVFRLPVRSKLDLSAFRADAPVMPISVKLDVYIVINHLGGDTLYGVHESLRFSEAMDLMWTDYRHATN